MINATDYTINQSDIRRKKQEILKLMSLFCYNVVENKFKEAELWLSLDI